MPKQQKGQPNKSSAGVIAAIVALVVAIAVIVVAAVYMLSGKNDSGAESSNAAGTSSAGETSYTPAEPYAIQSLESYSEAYAYVQLDVRNFGTIVLELDPSAAPITVQNFVDLTKSGFYDGLIFHRIISGFMIQGGDPEGTGYGGSPNTIKGEFSANGWENPIKHTRGVVSMARSGNSYDSASSQFFIVHKDSPHLNGQYAAFGHVVVGMDVVDAIAAVQTNPVNDRPYDNVVIEQARLLQEPAATE